MSATKTSKANATIRLPTKYRRGGESALGHTLPVIFLNKGENWMVRTSILEPQKMRQNRKKSKAQWRNADWNKPDFMRNCSLLWTTGSSVKIGKS